MKGINRATIITRREQPSRSSQRARKRTSRSIGHDRMKKERKERKRFNWRRAGGPTDAGWDGASEQPKRAWFGWRVDERPKSRVDGRIRSVVAGAMLRSLVEQRVVAGDSWQRQSGR